MYEIKCLKYIIGNKVLRGKMIFANVESGFDILRYNNLTIDKFLPMMIKIVFTRTG